MGVLKSSDERVHTEFKWYLTESVFGFLQILMKSRVKFKAEEICYLTVPLIDNLTVPLIDNLTVPLIDNLTAPLIDNLTVPLIDNFIQRL
jgi:hypothetical protein